MKRIAVYLLLVGSLTLPAMGVPAPKATKEELVKAELAKLEGTWKPVYFQRDGVEAPVTEVTSITFKGTSVTRNGVEIGKIIEIDPTANPKVIEYQMVSEVEDRQTQKAIYKLDGDSFIECIALGGAARPKELTSKEGSGHYLLKFERVKAEED